MRRPNARSALGVVAGAHCVSRHAVVRVDGDRTRRGVARERPPPARETRDRQPRERLRFDRRIAPRAEKSRPCQVLFRALEVAAAYEDTCLQQRQHRSPTKTCDGAGEFQRRVVDPVEAQQRLAQPAPSFGELGRDLGGAKELLASLLDRATFEEPSPEVDTRRGEPGIDAKRGAVVALGALSGALPIGEESERVVRRRQVRIQVAGFDEVAKRALEVPAPHLDETEVDPSLGEAPAVLQGEGDPCLGGLEVSRSQRRCASAIELDGPGSQRRRRAADRPRSGPQEQKQRDSYSHPPLSDRVAEGCAQSTQHTAQTANGKRQTANGKRQTANGKREVAQPPRRRQSRSLANRKAGLADRNEHDDRIDSLAQRLVAEGVAPQCAAGYAVWNGSWRCATGGAVDTLFDLASVTKPMTALAIARARIDRRTPIEALVPEARETPSEGVRLELFLAHRAGLDGHRDLYAPMVRGEAVDVSAALREAALARCSDAVGPPPTDGFPPLYSDLGYVLAGAGLAAATGSHDAGEAIERGVLEPLGVTARAGTVRGLRERGAADPFAPTEDVPWRGGRVVGAVHDENAWALTAFGGSGHAGIFATVDAVLAFGAAVLDAWTGRASIFDGVDLGWLVRPRPGGTLRAGFDGKSVDGSSAGSGAGPASIGHLGFTGTSLWIDPDARTVVALLTNRVCPSRQNVAIRTARPIAHDVLWRYARAISGT